MKAMKQEDPSEHEAKITLPLFGHHHPGLISAGNANINEEMRINIAGTWITCIGTIYIIIKHMCS